MLQDCKNNQIDYVVVKSVERFGRDTVDVVDGVRKIRAAGAQVYFQRENIDTAYMNDELSVCTEEDAMDTIKILMKIWL